MPSYIGLYSTLYSIGSYRPIYAYIGLYSIGCLQGYIGSTLVWTFDERALMARVNKGKALGVIGSRGWPGED